LLTDFGTSDYFAGAMKGVILAINPAAQLVDITHDIPAQDIQCAAFNLLAIYGSFPAGSINVAVVDPGVGSMRRPILVCAREQFFVGPDNGIFSYVLDREPDARIFELKNKKYFRRQVSNTFHGRDIFAPVAAALSKGTPPSKFGAAITDPVRLASLNPLKLKNGDWEGRVIHIDHFGNCITSFTQSDITQRMIDGGAVLRINGREFREFRQFYAEDGQTGLRSQMSNFKAQRSKLFAVWGSAGFLEIAARNQSAAKLLKAKRDDRIICRTGV